MSRQDSSPASAQHLGPSGRRRLSWPLQKTHLARASWQGPIFPSTSSTTFSKPRSAHLPLGARCRSVRKASEPRLSAHEREADGAWRAGRWVPAWRPRNSALGSTRLRLGSCPRSYKAGNGLVEKFKPGHRETMERLFCARNCTDTGRSKMNNMQPPPWRSSKFGGLQGLRQDSTRGWGKGHEMEKVCE